VEILEEGPFRNRFRPSGQHHQACYTLGVSIDVALPPFERESLFVCLFVLPYRRLIKFNRFLGTKVIKVAPRFVIVNLVGRSILVKQQGAQGHRYVGGPGGRSDALLVDASQRESLLEL
jgi:hypothetical protein